MYDMHNAQERLRIFFVARAISYGQFELASGKTSSYYINSKKALLHSEALCLLADVLFKMTRELPIAAVGGLEVGAIPMATALAMRYHQEGWDLEGFFVRKQEKDHGSKARIEGRLLRGMNVVIVDDVLTTGTSAMTAVQEVEKVGGRVEAVICIVDRLAGARELFEPKYNYQSIFTIKDFGIKPDSK